MHIRLDPKAASGRRVTNLQVTIRRGRAALDVWRQVGPFIVSLQISEDRSNRPIGVEFCIKRVLDAPDPRVIEVSADEHRVWRCRYKHDAGRSLRGYGSAAKRFAHRARRENQCLFDDVLLDVVSEDREVCLKVAVAIGDSELVVKARLWFNLLNRKAGRNRCGSGGVADGSAKTGYIRRGDFESRSGQAKRAEVRYVRSAKPAAEVRRHAESRDRCRHYTRAKRHIGNVQRIIRPQRLAVYKRRVRGSRLVRSRAVPDVTYKPKLARHRLEHVANVEAAALESRAVRHAPAADRRHLGDRIESVGLSSGDPLVIVVTADHEVVSQSKLLCDKPVYPVHVCALRLMVDRRVRVAVAALIDSLFPLRVE